MRVTSIYVAEGDGKLAMVVGDGGIVTSSVFSPSGCEVGATHGVPIVIDRSHFVVCRVLE